VLVGFIPQEARLLASMRCPNIVMYIGMCVSPPCVATEYCARGSLYDLLQDGRKNAEKAAELTWARRIGIATGAARGMLYLGTCTPPIIHRDLKSPNLLVGSDWTAKVADFNLSKFKERVDPSSAAVLSVGGGSNPRWLAPEIMDDEEATAASDVFSFGVVMWELLTWQLPWGRSDDYRVGWPCSPTVPGRAACSRPSN
jgi:serine/threonine protein kinase